MTLSCSCTDFDPAEHDSWWEPGRASIPPPGSRCCECNALLPDGEKRQTILAHTVVEPKEPMPEWPYNAEADEEEERLEAAWVAWAERNGWDSETERCVETAAEHRCERCGDLADAIEDMGYCMIAPGSLIEAHEEYVNDVQELADGVVRREIIWTKDKAGVWNPRRKTDADRRREARRRLWSRTKAYARYGWKLDLQYKVWHRVMRWSGYQYHYDYEAKRYHWKRRERKLPPWEREAVRGRDTP